MKNFILPGVSEHFLLNKKIILLHEEYPNFFKKDINIRCVYGNFGMCCWNGGRIKTLYDVDFNEDIQRKRDFFNDRNIPIRLTMTNPMITEEHLSDRYSNLILELLNNGKNEILVSSPILEEYILQKYPSYKLCSSTTKCLTNIDSIYNELDNNKYIQVCLDYNMNHNKKLLENMTENQKDKTEFLCNAICPPGCKTRSHHYKANGISTLNLSKNFTVPYCQIQENICGKVVLESQNNISPQEIEDYYEPLGFSNFKLEGRTISENSLILNYCYYMIKPEYFMQVASDLLN